MLLDFVIIGLLIAWIASLILTVWGLSEEDRGGLTCLASILSILFFTNMMTIAMGRATPSVNVVSSSARMEQLSIDMAEKMVYWQGENGLSGARLDDVTFVVIDDRKPRELAIKFNDDDLPCMVSVETQEHQVGYLFFVIRVVSSPKKTIRRYIYAKRSMVEEFLDDTLDWTQVLPPI